MSVNNKTNNSKNRRSDALTIEQWADLHEPDIMVLQETQRDSKSQELKIEGGWKIIEKQNQLNKYYSQLILIKPHIVVIESRRIIHKNIFSQYIIIKTKTGRLGIINMYIPSGSMVKGGDLSKTIQQLYKKISKKLRSWDKEKIKYLIMGDFNSHMPKFGNYSMSNLKRERERHENDFVVKNNLYSHPTKSSYTYKKKESKTYIDHVYSSHKNIIASVKMGGSLYKNVISGYMYPDHLPTIITMKQNQNPFKKKV